MGINYSNIISAAELMKRIASSHGYDWANRNDDLIPFKRELEPKLRRELKAMSFNQVGDVSEAIYKVILEDERDDEKIHDWLIFSSLKDIIADWDGLIEAGPSYPLELGEHKLFAQLISSIEQLYPLEKS